MMWLLFEFYLSTDIDNIRLPSRIVSAVGLGFRPLVAMLLTSLRKRSSY